MAASIRKASHAGSWYTDEGWFLDCQLALGFVELMGAWRFKRAGGGGPVSLPSYKLAPPFRSVPYRFPKIKGGRALSR